MSAHVFLRGWQQRRVETIINGFGDGLHVRVPRPQGCENLRFTHTAVRDIAGEERARIIDLRPVRGPSARSRSSDAR